MSCIQSIFYTEGPVEPTPHSHSTYQMLFVCRGSARLKLDEKSYALSAGSVVFLSNLENHHFAEASENYHRFVVNIRPQAAFSALAEANRLLSPFTDRPQGFAPIIHTGQAASRVYNLLTLLSEEVERGDFADGEAAILQTALQFLYRHFPEGFPCEHQTPLPAVRQLRRRFELNPAPDVSLSALAEEYHISESHLSHSFKKATGYSIGRYHLLCRLALAKELLSTTTLSVTTVANECGFTDMSNFSRYFRREVDCSPSDFRLLDAADKAD